MSTTSSKGAAVEAVTKKTETVTVGSVVSIGVKTPEGQRPTFIASDQDRPIYTEKTGPDTWVASWVAPSAGDHTITVTAGDADQAVFTVTAKSNQE